MITIVDFGLGNLGSIGNMIKKTGAESVITADPREILEAEKLILPGVGHFDRDMEKINGLGLRDVLDQKALKEKIPVLGICLGMQLLTRSSEEGRLPGLNWIPAVTKRFKIMPSLKEKIPHMGWNLVEQATKSNLTSGFDGEFRFYFVHSYCVMVDKEEHSILKTIHGQKFDSGIQKENIFGVQFHPEKSHKFGMKLFRNFLEV